MLIILGHCTCITCVYCTNMLCMLLYVYTVRTHCVCYCMCVQYVTCNVYLPAPLFLNYFIFQIFIRWTISTMVCSSTEQFQVISIFVVAIYHCTRQSTINPKYWLLLNFLKVWKLLLIDHVCAVSASFINVAMYVRTCTCMCNILIFSIHDCNYVK